MRDQPNGEGEKRFTRRAHNPETLGSTPILATIHNAGRAASPRRQLAAVGTLLSPETKVPAFPPTAASEQYMPS